MMIKRLLFLLLFTVHVAEASAAFVVKQLTCDYKVNPMGIDHLKPQLSWMLVSSDKNVLQSAYEIKVKEGGRVVWETGKVNSAQSVHIPYAGEALQTGRKYSWQVRVWDDKGKASNWSEVNTWEMGLLSASDWQAKWIEAKDTTGGKVGPAPMFRKGFTISRSVKSARLYITAHGLYEASLNGKRVGKDYFRPGWTSRKRLQYQTYDVAALLQKGQNAAEVTVGDGWYRGNLEFNNKRNTYGKEVGLLFQLVITYTDGNVELINSDGTWKSSFDGPILASDIYNGETYDARKEVPLVWEGVRVLDISKNDLVAETGPAVTMHENFQPVKMITTPKGEAVADFGQNLVGWVRLRVKGKAGDTVVLHHAEVLDKEGNFYTDNLRGAKQENRFILKGGDIEVLEPHFTFQGFRYVKVSGVMPEQLTAIALYSDMAPAGKFECSNPLINQLQHNIQWGQKGNFLDVPTDCPQRDERLGWTGDAQVFFNTAAYNMDVAGFFTKWLKDLRTDQHKNGNIPVVIPDVRTPKNAGSAGWGDVATIIPWNFYVAYGDKQLLQEQYQSMKAWVNYIRSISKDHLWNSGPHYGDWLFYIPNDDKDGKAAITDKFLIAQAFYAASTQNLINAARVLGNDADVKEYTALLDTVKKAFLYEYVAPSGRLVSSSQTAYVLALNFDLLPEEMRSSAAKRLVDNIAAYGNHLTTGFLGTPYLCHVLTRFGYNDVAYKLLLQDTYPSWLYPVKKGATTIWERWDGIKQDGSFQNVGMNSFNHYAYGAIGDWMYKVVAGINPQVGYKHIEIAPKPGGGLTTASASYKTLYGEVKSAWSIAGGVIKVDVTIPCNTTATITLPGKNEKLAVGSGDYHYEYAFAQ